LFSISRSLFSSESLRKREDAITPVAVAIPPYSPFQPLLLVQTSSDQCRYPLNYQNYSHSSKSPTSIPLQVRNVRPPSSSDIDHEQFNMESYTLPRLIIRHVRSRFTLKIPLPSLATRSKQRRWYHQ
jgi:hypothetical protein